MYNNSPTPSDIGLTNPARRSACLYPNSLPKTVFPDTSHKDQHLKPPLPHVYSYHSSPFVAYFYSDHCTFNFSPNILLGLARYWTSFTRFWIEDNIRSLFQPLYSSLQLLIDRKHANLFPINFSHTPLLYIWRSIFEKTSTMQQEVLHKVWTVC